MKQHQRVMAKANNIKLKDTEAVVVGPETTTSSGQQTIRIQNQSIVTTAAGPGGTQSNFILVRAARSDSGQLILQNGHELLTLLNESAAAAAAAAGDDNNKPIVIQQRSIKGRGNSGSNLNESTNSIAVHHQSHSVTRDTSSTASGSGGSQTILLQSGTGGMKKLTSADGSSIILQQTRLATSKSGSSDANSGPILLQTLKRLDKTPSILVIRNAGGNTTASTSKMVSAQVKTVPRLAQQQQQQETVTVITSEGRERSVERVSNSKQANIPLGSGKYKNILRPYTSFHLIMLTQISSHKISGTKCKTRVIKNVKIKITIKTMTLDWSQYL